MGSATRREGDTVGERFDIERAVATGGMGCVYRARDRHNGQPVALKLLAYQDDRAQERFLHEAMALAEVQHPGIVRYVAHGITTTGEPYLAMEWLDGEDLGRYLRRLRQAHQPSALSIEVTDSDLSTADGSARSQGRKSSRASGRLSNPAIPLGAGVPVAQVLQLGRRLAAAVSELHQRGIVHRDIKPGNLFLVGGGFDQVKLIDFGTVKGQLGSDRVTERVTEPGRLVGTPNYMAPEQARRDGEVGPATDVWAIGCVLYECLTITKPFPGNDVLEVLTRILLTDPEPLASLCPDAPRPLVALIERTLSKSAQTRPANAGELARELDTLAEALAQATSDSRPSLTPRTSPGSSDSMAEGSSEPTVVSPLSLTAAESRVQCMLFARGHRQGPGGTRVPGRSLDQAVASVGAVLQRLADGTLLVTIPDARAPTDQAARAARAALALRAATPGLAMVLATGRAEGPRQTPLAQVLRHASRTLAAAAPGLIRVDSLTASLLEARFYITRDADNDDAAYLEAERQHEAMRTLLGKPTPWVGRHRELAYLMATFEECVAEEVARAVLVIAPAGTGKSRLRYELEQALRRNGSEVEVLRGQGDAVSAGAPFVMIAPAIRRLVGIRDGEPLDERRRKLRSRVAETVAPTEVDRIAAFLGEMIGTPFDADDSSSLQAARRDPMLLNQLMQSAWEDWLRAECSHRPVLLVLEDLHWGDLPSVQYVDGALRTLQDAPFLVLALARPEVQTVFPQLWPQRDVQQMHLHALSRKACMALVREVLGSRVPEEVATAVIERAGGNAFYLEELIRAVAEGGPGGGTKLPDTVLGMVQARLDTLTTEARRVLRAASVFGEVFWQGGVEALLGEGKAFAGAFDAREWLDDLVAREVIVRQPEARMPGEVEYKFRHALVRDGAYALLTEEDRRLGHALAGLWLEQAGERDGLVLGEHHTQGGDPERAIPHFHRAAAQALEGNDLAAVIHRAERGVQAGAGGPVLGALRALQSVASYWLSDYAASQRYGDEAAALLAPGSAEWFTAVGNAIVSSARLGAHDRMDELFTAAINAPCARGAAAAQLICLSRGAFQLVFHGRLIQADQILGHIEMLAAEAPELDALTLAQVQSVHGARALYLGELGAFMQRCEAAVAAFERAGDLRNAALDRNGAIWLWAELGYPEHALTLAERNLTVCRQLGAHQVSTFTRLQQGYALSRCEGRLAEARQVLEAAARECRDSGNARLEGWARTYLTRVEHAEGRHADAEREAARAAELLASSPSLRAGALAAHARALLALGRPADALPRAREAMALFERTGNALVNASLIPLILAQALHATGDRDAARDAIVDAAARLEQRAAGLHHPEWREKYLGAAENRLTLALRRDWTGEAG